MTIKQKLKQTLDLLPATFQSKNFMAKKIGFNMQLNLLSAHS